MRRAEVIVAAAAAAAITMAAGSVRIQRYCVWQFRTVRTHHHSASSPAQSQQVSRAQCQDKAALEASLTNLVQVSIGRGALNR